MVTVLAALAALIWLYLFVVHGRPLINGDTAKRGHSFWRLGQPLAPVGTVDQWPRVAIIIPARDEVATVWPVVRAHLATRYPGPVDLTVIDDHSTDGTSDLARAAAGADPRFSVTAPPPLPAGWSGKLWALHHGIKTVQARAQKPDFILLTDADIVHAPDTLTRLVTHAVTQKSVMVSLMARLDSRGVWGGLLMPAFVYFFMQLYPFARVNEARDPLGGAAGGCLLVRTERLMAIGAVAAIRDALIDDCALAHRLKNNAPRASIFLALAHDDIKSLRDNRSLRSIWQMVIRTAYTQLRYNPGFLILTVIGLAIVYVLPITILISGLWGMAVAKTAIIFALISSGLMSVSFWPVLSLYKKSPLQALTLPVAALFYAMMTVHSAIQHWRGRGGTWKGRTYDQGVTHSSSVP
ncbi:MAG: glycosyltransferase [Pseudomonadota bacterium]